MKSNLVELRRQAEQAVHDMPEGELKIRAFETILTHLLSSGTNGLSSPAPSVGERVSSLKAPSKEKGTSPQVPRSVGDRVLSLKSDDFFVSQRSLGDIQRELKKNGWHYPLTTLSGPLQSLVRKRQLRREQCSGAEGRKGWRYSNP
jgi:hypothetical protein